jgi:hypothetical protein
LEKINNESTTMAIINGAVLAYFRNFRGIFKKIVNVPVNLTIFINEFFNTQKRSTYCNIIQTT